MVWSKISFLNCISLDFGIVPIIDLKRNHAMRLYDLSNVVICLPHSYRNIISVLQMTLEEPIILIQAP
jgi:hypothetical protein